VADGPYGALPKTIPHIDGRGAANIERALNNPALARAVRIGAMRAKRIVSICSGTFFFSPPRDCSMTSVRQRNWRSADLLADHFPKVSVERDALYVRDGNIWSSAGVNRRAWTWRWRWFREDFGSDVALAVARRHVLFLMRPGGQSQFSAHLSHGANGEGRLAALLRLDSRTYRTVDGTSRQMAARAKMSERTFVRAFSRETGETPARYVERLRLRRRQGA